MRTSIFGVLAIASVFTLTIRFSAQDAKVDFARDVQPIFRQQCYGCHGPAKQTNGFRLDRRSDAMRGSTLNPGLIRPGNGAASFMYSRIAGAAFGPQMPPTGALRPEQIATIKAWIDQGAVWPDGLSGDVPPALPDPKATRVMNALRAGDRATFQAIGSEPNRLSPVVPRVAMKTIITIAPTNGIKPISSHQPLRSISCRRRMPTAMAGIRIASEKRPERMPASPILRPKIPSMIERPIVTSSTNRKNIQYSCRRERPVNSA